MPGRAPISRGDSRGKRQNHSLLIEIHWKQKPMSNGRTTVIRFGHPLCWPVLPGSVGCVASGTPCCETRPVFARGVVGTLLFFIFTFRKMASFAPTLLAHSSETPEATQCQACSHLPFMRQNVLLQTRVCVCVREREIEAKNKMRKAFKL